MPPDSVLIRYDLQISVSTPIKPLQGWRLISHLNRLLGWIGKKLPGTLHEGWLQQQVHSKLEAELTARLPVELAGGIAIQIQDQVAATLAEYGFVGHVHVGVTCGPETRLAHTEVKEPDQSADAEVAAPA